LIDDICGSERAAGTDRIVVPGMFEAERRAQRLRDGIPLSVNLVDEIDALADAMGTPTLR
jgi:LDH2 family malate/lactate/ureidoglycolate dehydrogenase